MAAANQVKQQGLDNDLIQRIQADSYFAPIHDELERLLAPQTFTGLASRQVERFLAEEVEPALRNYQERLTTAADLTV